MIKIVWTAGPYGWQRATLDDERGIVQFFGETYPYEKTDWNQRPTPPIDKLVDLEYNGFHDE